MSDTNTVSPLRQRMIEDMAACKLGPLTQRGHISGCKHGDEPVVVQVDTAIISTCETTHTRGS
jgi:hypothetical protein